MEPEPSPETIIEAELVDDEPTYQVNLKKNNEINITEIQLFIREKTNQIVYEKIIVKDSDFWNKIKSKFQNNFDIFYVVLESALIKKTNDNLRAEIILENFNSKLKLELHYTSELFGFKINMFLIKQKEKIDILKEENDDLKKKVESLEEKLESLEEKVESLCKIVDMMGPQYMRSILSADTVYSNKNFSICKYIEMFNTTQLHAVIPNFNGVTARPVQFLSKLLFEENKKCSWKINDNEMDWHNSGNPPDALVWSKTAWDLIKKDKQWNID